MVRMPAMRVDSGRCEGLNVRLLGLLFLLLPLIQSAEGI
jgi:hypothetical protein